MNARPTLLGSNNKRPKNPTRGEGGRQEGQELTRCSWKGLLLTRLPIPHGMVQGKGMVLCSLTSSFKLVQSMLVSSTEQRLKVHKEQRLARRPTPQTQDSLQQPNFTSLLKVTLSLHRILTGLTFRKVDTGKFGFKVWHFC